MYSPMRLTIYVYKNLKYTFKKTSTKKKKKKNSTLHAFIIFIKILAVIFSSFLF